MFDDPTRFRTAGEVGSYIGMVPKQFDSGETERNGRITRHGNRLVRSLLVEVAWASLPHNPWARACYQRISGGKNRARRLPLWRSEENCWCGVGGCYVTKLRGR